MYIVPREKVCRVLTWVALLVKCALNELINEFDPTSVDKIVSWAQHPQYLPQQSHIRCVHSPYGKGVSGVELGGVVC